jgi:hypothetical protein
MWKLACGGVRCCPNMLGNKASFALLENGCHPTHEGQGSHLVARQEPEVDIAVARCSTRADGAICICPTTCHRPITHAARHLVNSTVGGASRRDAAAGVDCRHCDGVMALQGSAKGLGRCCSCCCRAWAGGCCLALLAWGVGPARHCGVGRDILPEVGLAVGCLPAL